MEGSLNVVMKTMSLLIKYTAARTALLGVLVLVPLILQATTALASPLPPKLVSVSDFRFEGKPLLLSTANKHDVINLQRVFEMAKFDVKSDDHGNISDNFRYVPFAINQPAKVQVNILAGSGKNSKKTQLLIPAENYSAGIYYFTLSYQDVYEILLEDEAFKVELLAEFELDGERVQQKVQWDGSLYRYSRGATLGSVVHHNVLLFRGELSLGREDINFRGVGLSLNLLETILAFVSKVDAILH